MCKCEVIKHVDTKVTPWSLKTHRVEHVPHPTNLFMQNRLYDSVYTQHVQDKFSFKPPCVIKKAFQKVKIPQFACNGNC